MKRILGELPGKDNSLFGKPEFCNKMLQIFSFGPVSDYKKFCAGIRLCDSWHKPNNRGKTFPRDKSPDTDKKHPFETKYFSYRISIPFSWRILERIIDNFYFLRRDPPIFNDSFQIIARDNHEIGMSCHKTFRDFEEAHTDSIS